MRKLATTIAAALTLVGIALATHSASSDAPDASFAAIDPTTRHDVDNLDIFI